MPVETSHYDFNEEVKKCDDVKLSQLDESIASILRKEGYVSCDVFKNALPADGGNYLATLCEIDVKGKTADGEEKKTEIFVKSLSVNPETVELVSITDVYRNELYFYKDLVHVFNEIQDFANIPAKDRLNTVKCYDESDGTMIIMENVVRKGFKTWNRLDVISLSMAEQSMKQLAKLHGLSFAIQEKRPDYFNKHIKQRPNHQKFNKEWYDLVEKLGKVGLEYLDDNLRSVMELKYPAISKKMEEYCKDTSTMYCLCHGDYRPNNIMIKEKDGVVTEVIPVDYQFLYYGCPVLDIIYYMYMATDRRFRDAHMAYLKDLYYTSLDEFLRYFDMSAESVLPRKVFENLFEEKMDFGLFTSFVILQFVLVSENDDLPDVTTQSVADIEIKLDDRYKERLIGAVEEMVELGYV